MNRRTNFKVGWVVGLLVLTGPAVAEPSAAAVAGYERYSRGLEARLERQHGQREGFVVAAVGTGQDGVRLRRGEFVVEELTAAGGMALPGALLHHWRGTAFAPGATAADFERLTKDVGAYTRVFAPEVLEARVEGTAGDEMRATMRVRQKHGITVVMDTSYGIAYGRLDPQHGWSVSRSTHVAEIAGAGTPGERALGPGEEHGFLWRQNTYWSFEELDGGLYVQVESVSLSRAIPRGLGWAVQPFVESVPRESIEFTLRSVCGGLRKQAGGSAVPFIAKAR